MIETLKLASIEGGGIYINLEKALLFGFWYGMFKGLCYAENKRGRELDNYLSECTGIGSRYFESMRMFRNILYHLNERLSKDEIIDLNCIDSEHYLFDYYIEMQRLLTKLKELV